jgi:hypothetical protein
VSSRPMRDDGSVVLSQATAEEGGYQAQLSMRKATTFGDFGREVSVVAIPTLTITDSSGQLAESWAVASLQGNPSEVSKITIRWASATQLDLRRTAQQLPFLSVTMRKRHQ